MTRFKERFPATLQDLQVIHRAKKLVSEGWCQKYGAKDSAGFVLATDSRHAAQFCILGAIERATIDLGAKDSKLEVCLILQEALGVPRADDLYKWNDDPDRTQAEVLALFDRATKICELETNTHSALQPERI